MRDRRDRELTLGVGVDFGTSNSVIATYDGRTTRLIDVEEGNAIFPSALYLDRELHSETGNKAIEAYVQGNRGRTVELVPEVTGSATARCR